MRIESRELPVDIRGCGDLATHRGDGTEEKSGWVDAKGDMHIRPKLAANRAIQPERGENADAVQVKTKAGLKRIPVVGIDIQPHAKNVIGGRELSGEEVVELLAVGQMLDGESPR